MVDYDWFRVEEWNALELQQGVIQRVSDEITNPLGNHDCCHDQQQELHIVSYFHLKHM